MGKRKRSARKPQGPKKREPLATTFNCLFCNYEKAIQVKLDKRAGIGTLTCKVCAQRFQSKVTYLSAPVDVFSDWVDACETVAKQQAESELQIADLPTSSTAAAAAAAEDVNLSSTYGTGGDGRQAGGAAAGGDGNLGNDDELINDDELLNDDDY